MIINKIFAFVLISLLSVSCLSEECTLSPNDTLPEDHLMFTMNILDDRLEGVTDSLAGFVLTMQLPKEFLEDGFDYKGLVTLVRNQVIGGTVTYPNGKITDVRYELVKHRGMEEIYMKTTLGYFLWECMDVQDTRVLFVIDWWYYPPVRKVDLQVIEMARKLLADSTKWHQEDDRKCDNDIESNYWSLFCALKHSSIELMGEYNHHNAAMQIARFVIDDVKLEDRAYARPLMDYNNDSATTYKDILRVLDLAGDRLKQKMQDQVLNNTNRSQN